MKEVSIDGLTSESFSKWVETDFRVTVNSPSPLELKLVEINVRAHSPSSKTFSIVFRGPAESFLPQGTYRFEHDGMGSFHLFIVPTGKNSNGFQYEATFNRG